MILANIHVPDLTLAIRQLNVDVLEKRSIEGKDIWANGFMTTESQVENSTGLDPRSITFFKKVYNIMLRGTDRWQNHSIGLGCPRLCHRSFRFKAFPFFHHRQVRSSLHSCRYSFFPYSSILIIEELSFRIPKSKRWKVSYSQTPLHSAQTYAQTQALGQREDRQLHLNKFHGFVTFFGFYILILVLVSRIYNSTSTSIITN